MIFLSATTDVLRVITSAAITTDVHVSWADLSGTTVTPGRTNTAISTAATTTILAAPAASTQRNAKFINIENRHATTAQTVTVQFFDGTTAFDLINVTLAAGEHLNFVDAQGWKVHAVDGAIKNTALSPGRLLKSTILTAASGTLTTQSATTKIRLRGVGGGGGSGGVTGAASSIGASGGGGAGTYVEKEFSVSGNTGYAYACGAAGTAGANTGTAGGTGGSSTFGPVSAVTVTAPGGSGGAGQAAGTTYTIAAGGISTAATNADVSCIGEPGRHGLRQSGTFGFAGEGGSSPFGGGGRAATGGNLAGSAGNGFGSGGGGSLSTSVAQVGSVGTAGIWFVDEFA